jgi:hypothetical protein
LSGRRNALPQSQRYRTTTVSYLVRTLRPNVRAAGDVVYGIWATVPAHHHRLKPSSTVSEHERKEHAKATHSCSWLESLSRLGRAMSSKVRRPRSCSELGGPRGRQPCSGGNNSMPLASFSPLFLMDVVPEESCEIIQALMGDVTSITRTQLQLLSNLKFSDADSHQFVDSLMCGQPIYTSTLPESSCY